MSKKSDNLNFNEELLLACNENLLSCLAPNHEYEGRLISVKFKCTQHPLKYLIHHLNDEMYILFSPSPIAETKNTTTVVGWNLTAPIFLIEIMLRELGARIFFIEAVPLFLERRPMQRISALKTLSRRYKCCFVFLTSSDKIPYTWMLNLACTHHFDLS